MGRVQFSAKRRRRWLAAVAAAGLVASAAQAQSAVEIEVRSGDLEAALLSLASQTGQQIFFARSLVENRRAPAVKGALTADEALAILLAGSDLQARRAGPGLIVVERKDDPKGTPTSSKAEQTRLEPASYERPPTTDDRNERPASEGNAPPVAVAELVVTGSNIRGGAAASPILVMDRGEIARSGQTTLAGALRMLPQNFGGGAAEGTATTGADRLARNGSYASGLNLRGLGNNATLVLINGRRVAGSGAFGDFVDISSIPTAAVERVEVLLDGASAIYGSDAVAGVVNVILRKDYEGAETRLLAGSATRGEPREYQFSQTIGHRWDSGGVLLAYELQHRDALSGDDRWFSATADLRPFGGRDHRQVNSFPGNVMRVDPVSGGQVPGWAIPAGQNGVGLRPEDLRAGEVNLQNPREGIDLIPDQTLNALYVALDQDVGERFEVTADARLASRRFRIRTLPQTSNLTVTQANPYFVSPVGATSHTIAYSFVRDLPNPEQSGSADSLSFSLGGSARLAGDWRAEAYLAYGQQIEEVRLRGALHSAHLSEALGTTPDRPNTTFSTARDGFFNPFGGEPGVNAPGVTAFIGSGFTYSRTRNRVYAASLQADGSVASLPGGALKLAAGVQGRREELDRAGTNFVSTAAPTAQASADVAREVLAAFAEVRLPIVGSDNRLPGVERLEITAAARVEHYDDVGTTTNPKVGVLWEPTPGLRLRATYGRSFRAPALREAHDAALYSPTLLPLGGARIRSLLLNGGNPELRPETATSLTAGFDLAPAIWPGFTFNASWFDVKFEDRIDRPVQANLVAALSDPTLTSFVERISPTTDAGDLARITALISSPAFTAANGVFPPEAYGAILDNRYVNTTDLRVRGLDATAAYAFDAGADRLRLSANAAYMLDYEQRLTPTSGVVERVGTTNYPVKFRSRFAAEWAREELSALVALNYVGAYRDPTGAEIDANPTLDLQLRWEPAAGPMRGTEVLLNVRNLFDRDPPFYDNTAGVAFDPANADPIGRFASLQLTRRW